MKAISTVGSGLHGKRVIFDWIHVASLLTICMFSHKNEIVMCLPGPQERPEFGAGQDALGLLVCHPDQRLLVDRHQLVADLQPPVLRQRRGKP